MSPRSKRRKPRQRPQGFSTSTQRPLWELMFRSQGVSSKEKRQYFNQLSGIMILSVGIGCAAAGSTRFGVLGAIVGFVIGVAVMGKWVTKNRYFR